ncbi:conserved hypothetical protein [Frankia sp. AiPs1]|uniref:hypothetical protein n=1 Tax=Frankia sp. AiPa1 TaxID=573492 RepID=UPI00202B46B3|nr:hypothetical protein [Frankia sp. AiPa1]MCL9762215.1 hypothetical protein [Frankia sp. AiPa1]
MIEMLPAAAFGLVPFGQAFARELHAAPTVGLRPDQMPGLVGPCTMYAAESDALMAQMAGGVARVHEVMYGPELPSTSDLAAVDLLLVGWSSRALALGRTWVTHRTAGLATLDPDQVKAVHLLRQARRAQLVGAWQDKASDWPTVLDA